MKGQLNEYLRTAAVTAAFAVSLAGCGATSGSPGDSPAITLEPREGSPGVPVVVTASGLPPDQPVEIGFGPPASEYEVIAEVRSAADGSVMERVRVPDWAEPGREYVFVVAEAAGGPERVKLISQPFQVPPANP